MDSAFTNDFSQETWYQKYKLGTDNSIEDTWHGNPATIHVKGEKDYSININSKYKKWKEKIRKEIKKGIWKELWKGNLKGNVKKGIIKVI